MRSLMRAMRAKETRMYNSKVRTNKQKLYKYMYVKNNNNTRRFDEEQEYRRLSHETVQILENLCRYVCLDSETISLVTCGQVNA
jgi:hypothetical protein